MPVHGSRSCKGYQPWEQVDSNCDFWEGGPGSGGEKLTPFKDITNYNNYYEFSTDKYEPAQLAKDLKTRPWTVKVEGLVKNPKVYDVDSLIKLSAPEERIYRHRCVEGWSMVMPWVGFSLSVLINKVEPLAKAKYGRIRH